MLAEATTGLTSPTSDLRLLNVVAKALLTKKGSNYIAALLWLLLLSHFKSKLSKNTIIEIGLVRSGKRSFNRNLSFITILDTYLHKVFL